jgi:hypothetical protein
MYYRYDIINELGDFPLNTEYSEIDGSYVNAQVLFYYLDRYMSWTHDVLGESSMGRLFDHVK